MTERDAKYIKISVAVDDAGQRLDRFLKKHFPTFRTSVLQKALRIKDIRINGVKGSPQQLVEAGDRVWVYKNFQLQIQEKGLDSFKKNLDERSACKQKAEALELQKCIMYEDDHVVVLNKPNGLPTQGGTGIVWSLDRLLEGLLEKPLYMVHRLDRQTSGVWVMAKSKVWARKLSVCFQKGSAHKTYLAVLNGSINPSVLKENPAVLWLRKEPKGAKENMDVSCEAKPGFKKAITAFNLLDTCTFSSLTDHGYGAGKNQKSLHRAKSVSLVRFYPLTGRTHQLRVQSAVWGAPVLGDCRYGVLSTDARGERLREQGKQVASKEESALFLHAETLCLKDFQTGEVLYTFNAPLPLFFQVFLEKNHLHLTLTSPEKGDQ